MWNTMVDAAQNPALHGAVVAFAVLAYVYKVLRSSEGLLMGDMYPDEHDFQ